MWSNKLRISATCCHRRLYRQTVSESVPEGDWNYGQQVYKQTLKGIRRDVHSGIFNHTAMDGGGMSGMDPESGPAHVLFHNISHCQFQARWTTGMMQFSFFCA